VHAAGYALAYVPEAVIHNRGPDTLHELLKRRRSNAYGHRSLEKNGYQVSTKNNAAAGRFLIEEVVAKPSYFTAAVVLVMLEIAARALAVKDAWFPRKNLAIWEIAQSTKKLNAR